jgi:hypothetical protein
MMTQGAFLRGNDLQIVYTAAQARSARNLEQERFQGGTGRDVRRLEAMNRLPIKRSKYETRSLPDSLLGPLGNS